MGIFSKQQNVSNPVKYNTFDGSFSNHLTLPFGALVPCFVKEVVNGDKFRIRASFGLNFLPTLFPIQSKVKADLQFFYIRNRNIQDGWKEFQFQSDNKIQHAIFKPDSTFPLHVGSLSDYLGLPCTVPSSFVSSKMRSLIPSNTPSRCKFGWFKPSPSGHNFIPSSKDDPSAKLGILFLLTIHKASGYPFMYREFDPHLDSALVGGRVKFILQSGSAPIVLSGVSDNSVYVSNDGAFQQLENCYVISGSSINSNGEQSYPFEVNLSNMNIASQPESALSTVYFSNRADWNGDYYPAAQVFVECNVGEGLKISPLVSDYTVAFKFNKSDLPISLKVNKFSTPDECVSVLPFRAYESIYNAFYRDERVNPLIINGEKVYNKYVVNTSDGLQTSGICRDLYYRNWELDYLTSAQLTPQDGVAPLVGVTSNSLTFKSSDGQTYTVEPELADDGTVLNAAFTSDTPGDVRRSFINYATTGISINDFRNVNALQRWLETNLRRGFKYRDQIMSHFGIQIKEKILDMPEFLGGFSNIVDSTKVTQTSESTDSNPLGSYAGNMTCFGSSKHDITCSCDESGFIIGIICVYPVPVYSQLLNKFWLYRDNLDYYDPLFSKIGYQPILNCEVSPSTCLDSTEGVQTFGYQRPWYQLLSNVDECHGEFRSTLKDFLFRRDYANTPSLGPDFTVINPETLTDPFAVQDTSHKIMGQVAFDVRMVRPIPRYNIPSLE